MGAIEFDTDGFQATRRGISRRLLWSDVHKIEVFRIPTAVVEDFVVALFGAEKEPLLIDDVYPDFKKVEEEIWVRWPVIKDRWIEIYCGSPEIPERAVLWERVGA